MADYKTTGCEVILSLSVAVPGLPVCHAHGGAGGPGGEHHHRPAALPSQGQPGGAETGDPKHSNLNPK